MQGLTKSDLVVESYGNQVKVPKPSKEENAILSQQICPILEWLNVALKVLQVQQRQ